jgi:alkanesulfonate monooxygenase SsuD/methylene tetrahydromethanopterin reductase-like flavin-dependent oxidoreductase (luciferase family)
MTQQVRVVRLGIHLDHLDDPGAAVEAAIAAEQLGYDYVVVPEHSEDVAWDPWMLLSWIAARTERIGLVTAGLDTLRPPTVLARAAASLDLLAGGRVVLGLANGPADGLDAMSKEESPEVSAAALHDAVTIVRRMWDASAAPVHHHGHHRVAGAEPGPLPAHDIPVWLRGDEPSTVELAGRVADGWMGHLGIGGPDRLIQHLRMLDQHAAEAGRDPRELQRVVTVSGRLTDSADPGVGFLSGPSERWVSDLVPLIVQHGVTTLVLRVDGANPIEQLERFAREVAPGLDEAARQAMTSGDLVAGPLRRADVRAHRRPGIDYDGLPEPLAATAVEPGDLGYGAVRSTYLRGGNPGLVLRPRTAPEVAEAVAFARRHRHLPLGVRSGGHGISGRSTNDGGLVVDLGALSRIQVLDEARRLVRIDPGARWKQVATALQPHGWALGSGDYGGVGVGGLATAGGIGFLGRKHGLTIDHLDAVEMVLADGSLVRASESEHPELFWAVRGAGANFGIATAFEFVVDDVPDVGWAQLAFQVADPAAFLVEFGRAVAAAPRETTPNLIMGRSGIAQVMAMVASDDPEVVVSQLQPFARIAPLAQQQVVIAPYAAVMNMFPDAPHEGRGEPVSRSGLVTELSPEVAAASARLLSSGAVHWYQIRSMGGAIADVAPDATAFAHRDAGFSITAMGANAQRVDRWWDGLRPYLSGIYLSFETDTSPARLLEAFPPGTLARLRALKAELDPTNLFRDNFNLVAVPAPIPATSGSPA